MHRNLGNRSEFHNSDYKYFVRQSNNRLKMSYSLCVILLCSICIPPIDAHQYQIANSNLSGIFLEYSLEAHIIVLWNYTIDENNVFNTTPGQVLYENEDGLLELNEIRIRVKISEYANLDFVTMTLTYCANIPTKYIGNQSIVIEYSLDNGSCEIRNGTLSNRTGIFWLIADNVHESSIMSRICDEIVEVESVDNNCYEIVLDEQQECLQYTCKFSHIVDGNVSHHRVYDKDTHVLVGATGGVSDFILLGLNNISYAVGRLFLLDTNLDLGTPAKLQNMEIPAAIGIGAFGTFVTMYIVIYRAQRSQRSYKNSQKKKRKLSRRSFLVMQA